MALIIALKGPSQSGKSTLAKLLADHYTSQGRKVVRTSFGDFVREEIFDTVYCRCTFMNFGCTGSGRYYWEVEPHWAVFKPLLDAFNEEHKLFWAKDKSAIMDALTQRPASASSRVIQQWWGQDFRRAQDPLYWVKKSFAANVEHILEPDTVLIEESCRQPNEGAYIHAMNGVVLDLKPLPAPTAAEEAGRAHSVEQVVGTWVGDIEIDMVDYFQCPTNDRERHQHLFIARLVTEIADVTGHCWASTCSKQTGSRTSAANPGTSLPQH